MDIAPTQAELALFDEISRLGAALWSKSTAFAGLSTDPKMFSVMLYKRLWSNHRGYTVLWKNSLSLEGDIILRAGLEAAICLAANLKLRDEFVSMMRADAAFTLQGQIKIHRNNGAADMVRDGENVLRDVQSKLAPGAKAAKLDWAALAKAGGVPQLYDWHRMLSGVSSHVTGLSVLTGIVDGFRGDVGGKQKTLQSLNKKMHLMMMAGATLQGSMIHAGMIEADDLLGQSLALIGKMNEVSVDWPGAS
jgi:hypothetical protein